jgi:hypothetical protein
MSHRQQRISQHISQHIPLPTNQYVPWKTVQAGWRSPQPSAAFMASHRPPSLFFHI